MLWRVNPRHGRPTRSQLLRRRLAAALVLVAGLVVIGVLVGQAVGGDGDGPAGAHARTSTGAHAGRDGAARGGGDRADPTAAAAPTAGRDMGQPGSPRPVPILMYHVTTEPPANAPFPDLYVTRDEFADQMQALADAGYVAVTQQEVWDAWHRGGPLPRRAVVVSVDDGYRSNYLYARPVLRKLGWPGVLNLKVGNLREYEYGINAAQVRELIADGWEVDSHTIDHPDLTTVDAATLTREVAQSRRALQDRFGVPVNFFCYPAGRYDDAVIAAVQAAGYLGATTVEPGLAQPAESDRFVLDRVRVNSGVSGATLVQQLAGMGAAG
jgi:peptidoglycan/xylan/chitin deacetylase (PgdA/CDA1 family)